MFTVYPILRPLSLTTAVLGLSFVDVRSTDASSRVTGTRVLRVASLYRGSALGLDPAALRSPAARTLALNLYGRLIEHDADGGLIPGLSRGFEWRGTTLVLHFDHLPPGAVTATDAAWSLRRLLMVSTPVERVARDFFCPGAVLTSPDAPCAGIAVDGQDLMLTPTPPHRRAQMVTALTRPEFSVVRREGLDPSGSAIVNLGHTTGPYRVLTDDPNGAWRLVASAGGPGRRAAGEVRLIPVDDGHAFAGSTASPIDFAAGDAVDAADLATPTSPLTVHETLPLRLRALRFSKHALRRTTVAQRAHVARLIESAVRADAAWSTQPALEIVPAGTHGALTPEQRTEVRRLHEPAPRPTFDRPLVFATPPGERRAWAKRLRGHSEVTIATAASRPDVEMIDTDFPWSEDDQGLAERVINGVVHTPGDHARAWLDQHLRLTTRHARADHLRADQLRSLRTVAIYPLDVRPQFAVSTRRWRPAFTPFSTEVEFKNVHARD